VRAYKGKRIGLAPPHIFAIAESAFNAMVEHKQNQSVLVRCVERVARTIARGVLVRLLLCWLCASVG